MLRIEDELRRILGERIPQRAARPELRPAAVLVPLVCEAEDYKLLLTRRAATLRRQPGDISFPGGAVDSADSTALAAALRECEEEVGLQRKHVEILGQMDERETVTGFRVTPFVGAVRGPYVFQPNHEVEELLLVPLSLLRRPGVLRVTRRKVHGKNLKVFHYAYQGYDIWGITGRIIHELLDLIPGGW